ncbi:hypothetical protein [Bosea sp. BIWAKO-01]|uniref:hypothetical protein n=1 Tax=Bosea sp. BIWAKO-01 TaxID=506668 RepID=UPI000852D8B6|nr:hypothetical protein [Bosea sp. BIWAKO-01]GAU85741.1 hypothetical protein BIWAKO_05689 [Bosea sp. BIWAKO-01]
MITYKIALVGGLLALFGMANTAQAYEFGPESIVHEQYQNPYALQEQQQYRAYHEHMKELREHPYVAPATRRHHG